MKIKNSKLVLLTLCFSLKSLLLVAQSGALRKANNYYDSFAYIKAISAYEQIVENGNGSLEVYQKLGDSYYFNAQMEEADKWYQKMMDTGEKISSLYYFRAAKTSKFLENYDRANEYFRILETLKNDDVRVQRYLDNKNYLEEIEIQSGRYNISNVNISSPFNDFAPSFFKDKLVFSSSKEKKSFSDAKNKWSKQPYLELYSGIINENGEIEEADRFSKRLATRLHESTSAFTKDGKTIYFTRNNIINSKMRNDTVNVTRLKIFTATNEGNGKWTKEKELPFNNDNYSVAHPTLSQDERKLYFASDMPGGFGMSDIYVVDILGDGKFSEPRNLGPKINSEYRDTFPFISKDGTLYFASDGHLGLGGLDIFATMLRGDEQEIYNLGKPVNSPADDMTFIINAETKRGFFASNRTGGKGGDDIYSILETKSIVIKCQGNISGLVVNKDTGKTIADASIEIRDNKSGLVYKGKTDSLGTFSTDVDCNLGEYAIATSKDKFFPDVVSVNISRTQPMVSKSIMLQTEAKPAPKSGVDIAKVLNLNPIYFDTNKALITDLARIELDKVLKYLKEYPTVKIEIGSHTDSRGSDAYNLKLSSRRAKATANYIISKGIDASRIKSKGYGETVLRNGCGNGVKCSKLEHADNRRSEFIVIES